MDSSKKVPKFNQVRNFTIYCEEVTNSWDFPTHMETKMKLEPRNQKNQRRIGWFEFYEKL
jgi:hypothetical protein